MNYWEKRFLKDKASAVNAAEKYIARRQERYFREAQKAIAAAVEKLYRSFADSEKITLAEAKRRISNADFKKIDFESMAADQLIRNQEYREKMKDLPDDVIAAIGKQNAQYESQLAAYTKKGEITYLTLMQANIDKALIDLYDKNQISMYDMLASQYEDGYYRSVYNTQQAIGFGKDLAALNKRAIEKAVLAKHNKSNYSKTLYEHCSHFSEDLKQNLVVGLIRGENMDRMASRMRKRLSVSASAARRLVRTETAYIYESATMDAYKECGIEQYEYLATLDGRTSEICRELDGKVFDIKDAVPGKNYPPMHPNCRSTTVCHFADDKVTSRIAKDESGKYYEVPSDMTYKEWKSSHVKSKPLSINGVTASVALDDVNLADTHEELEEYLAKKYHIQYAPQMKELNISLVKRSVSGMEEIIADYPGIVKYMKTFFPVEGAAFAMACNDRDIKFNKELFQSGKGNHDYEHAGRHEAAHLIEWLLIDKMGYADREAAWNTFAVSDIIVKEAVSEIHKTGVKLTRMELIRQISENALHSSSEALADCVADYYEDVKHAKLLSKYVVKQIRRYL